MRDYQKYAIVLAVFAVALYLALIVAVFGLISLATDQEVVPQSDAGLLLGPTMVGAAVLAEFLLVLRLGVTRRPERQRVAVGFSVVTGLVSFTLFIVVGAVLYTVSEYHSGGPLAFAGSMLLSPFPAAVGLLAAIVTLCYSLVLATQMREHGRPLWPWER